MRFNRFFSSTVHLLIYYLISLFIFTTFRIVHVFAFCNPSGFSPTDYDFLKVSFITGFKFDTIVACYFGALLLLMSVLNIFHSISKKVIKMLIENFTIFIKPPILNIYFKKNQLHFSDMVS